MIDVSNFKAVPDKDDELDDDGVHLRPNMHQAFNERRATVLQQRDLADQTLMDSTMADGRMGRRITKHANAPHFGHQPTQRASVFPISFQDLESEEEGSEEGEEGEVASAAGAAGLVLQ